jgi:outer membrane protein assembly factor BamD (BamD/ComL family)
MNTSNVHSLAPRFFLQIAFAACVSYFFAGCTSTPDNKTNHNQNDSVHVAQKQVQDCDRLLREAKKMDSVLMQQMEIDLPSAQRAIKAFADFGNFCPTDSLSPVFLIKCAQVARAINSVPQAKVVLEKCIRDYPNFRDRPAAIFLLAQLYDEVTYLNNENEAKVLYEQIIAEYPNSEWAYSAKGALTFLGKSDQEIMQTLKKRKTN